MNVDLVPVHAVDQIWPLIAERVVACLKKAPTGMTAGDHWTLCRSGQDFLIIPSDDMGINAVTIWRFANGYFECLLQVKIPGNPAEKWFPAVIEYASEIARKNGCRGICGSARIGWYPLMKKHFPATLIKRQTYALEF